MSKEEKKISRLKVLGQDDSGSNGASLVDEVNSATPLSRRRFLQIAGAATAVGAVGCADKASQNIFPNVKGNDQQIPGVSVWYSSTCTECSAGCGIKVRTREGRAVKIEGNVDHPVNEGGLCAMGQSSLQALYDPDRVRQPLKKSGATFEPISWDEAYTQLGDWLRDAKKKVVLTNEISGALLELVNDFSQKYSADHVVWDLLQPTALAAASEATFGTYGIPQYNLEKVDTLINFGADFLETWVSPCEYAKGWARSRKAKRPIRVVQIEPRLSLTGANADLWLAANPGTEAMLAAALLKMLVDKGFGAEYKSSVQKVTSTIDVNAVCDQTGIKLEKLSLIAEYLSQSESSLVLSGGTVGSGDNAYELSVICNLINLVLGNVGKTIDLSKTRGVQTSVSKIKTLIETLNTGAVDLLLVQDTNPVFTLPASFNFKYAMKKAAHIVSFASHIDETSELADLILPSNVGLESWGDQRQVAGVYSLQQPSMNPVFDTKDFADSLITISEKAGKSIAAPTGKDFKSYLKESWKKIHAKAGTSLAFEDFWRESLERGGFFQAGKSDNSKASVSAKAYDIKLATTGFTSADSSEDIMIYPYASVKSFDGRAANRPWLQELPDPITQISWDSWAEIHPTTAKAKELAQGDIVTVRNNNGELNLPVYVTKHIKEGMIAVPIGQGHTSYGRYAKKVTGGNVLDLISFSKDANDKNINLFSAKAKVFRGRGTSDVVIVQGSDSQQGRDLAQTKMITAGSLSAVSAVASNGHADANGGHAEHAAHGGGEHGATHGTTGHGTTGHGTTGHGTTGHGAHAPKQMYEQRGHPLYHWAMAIDLATCTGCAACVVACYAENNIPVVGKTRMGEGREMSWLRIERYYEGEAEELKVSFLPMMCQHCGNAPCEPVCPVYATYHNEEGLNAMIYNRCVGTRYCSNNCSYKVRRFNWFEYELPEPMEMQLNPDVMKRTVGIMEKCSFCVQRIAEAKDVAKDLGRPVKDGEITPACAQGCATGCITFGNLNDPDSAISKLVHDERAYKVLDHHINTQPAVSYLRNIRYTI